MVNISFPGIGIDTFSVNPVAFSIGDAVSVRWYGILITLGIILAIVYCNWRSKQEGITFDDLLDMAIFTIIFAVIGARLYYVLTSLDKYDNFLDVFKIWNGGLAIYGGIIAGAITIYFVCRHKKINVMKAYDMVVPAVMIGQIIGRWGNFFNGEAHGTELIEGDFLYFIRMGLSYGTSEIKHFYHPTFLYESVWNLIGFVIINLLYKKKKFDGQVFLMYITWYGFGRMLIEGLRTDSLYVGVFRISQVVGFVCFVVGVILLIINLSKARRAALAEADYAPSFSVSNKPAEQAQSDPVDEEKAEEEEEEEIIAITEEDEADISDKLKNLFDDNN